MQSAEVCVNFRDVGMCVNLIAEREILPEGRILRGGKLQFVGSAEQIGNPGTIVNLRKSDDPIEQRFGADYRHFAIANDHEKYDTTDRVVRRWLNAIFQFLADGGTPFPILFHCTSGKDRTGVVVATLLTALGVDREIVIAEYLWSDGEVQRDWIERTLEGIGDPAGYFPCIDLASLYRRVMRG